MIPERNLPQSILIYTKIVNGTKVYVWNNRPFATEYLARKEAQKAAMIIEKSIKRTCV